MSLPTNLAKAALALVSLVALGALLVLIFGSQVGSLATATPVAQTTSTPPPYPPPGSPTALVPTATPGGSSVIPPCEFTTAPASVQPRAILDAYVFSELREVLTHTAAIDIAGWLPDGERILIIRRIPDQPRETIETFNVRTGEIRWYAERYSLSSRPAWLAAQQAVAFVDVTSPEGRAQWVLRLGRGEGQPVETLQTDLASPEMAADPAGRQVSILLRNQGARPGLVDVAERTARTLAVRLPAGPWQDSSEAPLEFEQIYHMAWSPKGKWLAYYNMDGLYLIEVATGQVCLVDLGDCPLGGPPGKCWALDAKWSPDERYLAMLTVAGRLPVHYAGLMILDTATGGLRSVHPEAEISSGLPYVADMAWAADNQAIIIRSAAERKGGIRYESLHLVDVVTGQIQRVLPQTTLIGGYAGLSLAWSPNRDQLAVNWPTRTEGRLYLVTVTTRQ